MTGKRTFPWDANILAASLGSTSFGQHMETVAELTRCRAADGAELEIGPLSAPYVEPLFGLFADIVARGEGFPHQPPLARAAFEDVWARPATVVVGAVQGHTLAGAYYLKPNLPGLGAHIANAGYIVDRAFRHRGIGRALVEDSIARAPLAGFDAIQFNFVFADNPARSLYEELGWRVVGTIPDGAGPGRDALIYWRSTP